MAVAAARSVGFHNPRCSTSRKTFDLLRESGVEPEVVLDSVREIL